MKIKKSKFIAWIAIVGILINCLTLTSNAAQVLKEDYFVQSIENIIENEKKQTAQVTELNNEINQAYSKIIKQLNSDASAEKQFPDYFGGTYIDDNQSLVVYVDQSNDQAANLLRNVAEYDNVIIKSANYSYNVLFSEKEEITSKIKLLKERHYSNPDLELLLNSFSGVGIDDTNNCIFVDIYDLNETKIQAFRDHVSDFEAINFYEGNENTETATTMKLYSGERMYIHKTNSTSWKGCSVGFRAWKLSDTGTYWYGFVTAGHSCNINEQAYLTTVESEAMLVGAVIISKNSGTVDAAFVAIDTSEYEMQPYGYYSDDDGNTGGADKISTAVFYTSVAEGREVIKNGATTFRTTGKVKSSSYDAILKDDDGNETTISDCIKSNNKNDDGDSGSIVYSPWEDGDTENIVVGILVGGNSGFLGIGRSAIIVKITNIRAELGVDLH